MYNNNIAAINMIETIYADLFDGFNISKEEQMLTNTFTSKKLDGFGSSTYGEVSPESVVKLMELLDLRKDDLFYDLGCGVGKALLHVALLAQCKKCVGVELAKSRYQSCVDAHNHLLHILSKDRRHPKKKLGTVDIKKEDLPEIEFKNDDILKCDISEATAVYWNNVCFPSDISESILWKLTGLKKGSRLLTLNKICARHSNSCAMKGSPCAFFTLTKQDYICSTWTPRCTAFVYERN